MIYLHHSYNNSEETGVIGSTATTRRYRSYRREMEVRVLHRLQINDYLFHSVDIIYSTYMNCFLRSSFVRIGCHIAGWSSWLARWPHEPKVVGPSPTPATQFIANKHFDYCFFIGEKISYIASCL